MTTMATWRCCLYVPRTKLNSRGARNKANLLASLRRVEENRLVLIADMNDRKDYRNQNSNKNSVRNWERETLSGKFDLIWFSNLLERTMLQGLVKFIWQGIVDFRGYAWLWLSSKFWVVVCWAWEFIKSFDEFNLFRFIMCLYSYPYW